ncbi:MAG: TonB family protein [Bacteroidales bacterium]|nr:TonB family protein [Bacteroidales bacterium]
MKTIRLTSVFIILIISFLGLNLNAQNKAPEPKSGFSLTKKIIQNHLNYPKDALEQKKGGKITVFYDVDDAGNATNYRVENAFDEQCAEEAIRLVKMIEWNPAIKNGKPAAYNDYYTVEFSPKSYKKAEEKTPRPMLPQQEHPAQKSNKVFNNKELHQSPMPYFENKNMTMATYLRLNLQFPDQAKQFEIQGTVKLSFIVETDGRASNILVENSVGGGCDNEAIRLVQNLLWTPGVKNDSLVRTRMTQDITFQIGERNYYDGNSY